MAPPALVVRVALALVLTLGPTARAQQADTDPLPPLVRIDAQGPAAWRSRLLPTNLGTMFASAEGEKLLAPWIEQFDAIWGELHGAERAAARAQFLDFAGRLVLGVWAAPNEAAGRDPQPVAVFAVVPEQGDDPEPLVAPIARCMGLLAQRAERQIGGRAFTVAQEDDVCCTMPQVLDGRIVVLAAEHAEQLEDAARLGLPWLQAHGSAPEPAALLRVAVDLAQTRRLSDPAEKNEWFVPLGFASLGELSLALGADGPQVKADLSLRFLSAERGVFAALFPERAGVPALADLVPPNAAGWKVGRLDLLALWQAALRSAAASRNITEEEALAEARESTGGVDVGKDLLAHLRDEVLVLRRQPEDGAEPAVGTASLSLVMPMVDEPALRAAAAKALAASPFVVEEIEGVLCGSQEGGWFLPDIHVGIGRGLAVMAFGDDGDLIVDTIMKQAKKRTPAPPADVARLQRRAPAGFNSVGALGVQPLLRLFVDGLPARFGPGLDIDAETLAQAVADWDPLLVRHDLSRVLLLTGCADARWCGRVLW